MAALADQRYGDFVGVEAAGMVITIGAGCALEPCEAALKMVAMPKMAASIVPMIVRTVAKVHVLISAFILFMSTRISATSALNSLPGDDQI